jgi:hypothetical protein
MPYGGSVSPTSLQMLSTRSAEECTRSHGTVAQRGDLYGPRADLANTFDPVLRNCLIEIMTPRRFVERGEPVRVSEDDTGVLGASCGPIAA